MKVFTSGIFRSSYSSYFAALLDTGRGVVGADPIFNNARTTGSGSVATPSSLIGGSAAVSASDRLVRGVTGLTKNVSEENELTKQDMRNFMFSLPFTNLPLIKQIIDGSINASGYKEADN